MKAVISQATQPDKLLAPQTVNCRGEDIDALLEIEWLVPNKIGAYASSTVVGCNTRRYHGLLIAAGTPPTGRAVTLSCLMEQLEIDGTQFLLSTNEFADTFSPRGVVHLVEFRNGAAATFVFRAGPAELVKEVILAESVNAVAVRYTLRGADAVLRLWPFVAMRDFHHLRNVHQPHGMTFRTVDGGAAVRDGLDPVGEVHLVSREARFDPKPQWWYRFCYRKDIARGQDGFEDLYTPGAFEYHLSDGQSCQFTASLNNPIPVGFTTTSRRRSNRLTKLAESVGPGADETTRRLAAATDAFVVQRSFPNSQASPTILAGYHWFADWGRDAFVAMPGLLLETRQFEQARGVFRTFIEHMSNGMIPNRFDDYSPWAHFNSIDASLWFVVAAERYLRATDDVTFWRGMLMPACNSILTAYYDGAQFDIRADGDGLLTGGSATTQLTWMDAALGDEAITPRHGKAVEVNALWHSANRIMAHRCAGIDETLHQQYAHRSELIASAFVRTFWNNRTGCLYDCVNDDEADASIRPNQIFAVSLPHSPLSHDQQRSVVATVKEKLLTPMGLRTLSPDDSRFRSHYGGSWESRDRAYHQGTVWAWLMGAFVEAYLKVESGSDQSKTCAAMWLSGFDEHLSRAGIGFVSEIFDGDEPHTPRGCIAQAWSVAEVLRAKRLVASRE